MNASSVFMMPQPRVPERSTGPYVPMRNSNLNDRNTETYQKGTFSSHSNDCGGNTNRKDYRFTPFRRPNAQNTMNKHAYVHHPISLGEYARVQPVFTSMRTGNSNETTESNKIPDKKEPVKPKPAKKITLSSKSSAKIFKAGKDTRPDAYQSTEIPDDSTVIKSNSPECEMPSFIAHYVMLGCIFCGVIVLGVMMYIYHETTQMTIKEFMTKNTCFKEGNSEKLL